MTHHTKQQFIEKHSQTLQGMKFYKSFKEFINDQSSRAYYHLVKKAWTDLNLSAVISVNNIPTIYLKVSSSTFTDKERAQDQRLFWNQGLAKILISTDKDSARIYSGLVKPTDPDKDKLPNSSLIETLSVAAYAQRLQNFYLSVSTGQYYRKYQNKFNTREGVDSYLLENLSAIRDAITTGEGAMPIKAAHSFLARILFTSYLVDRKIVDLSKYEFLNCPSGSSLLVTLNTYSDEGAIEKIHLLFDQLKNKFNGSMFDYMTQDDKDSLKSQHIGLLKLFLQGDEVKKKQRTLGFWAYDFSWISVETISSIYEDFLAYEDEGGRHKSGAYYTPHFLAESTLDIALQNDDQWMNKRYIDPACGSGMFLVTMFHRLSAEWLINHPNCSYEEKAKAVLDILTTQLCGVDINLTACRITCFSLYLAFLDAFDPPDIFQYIEKMQKKLPNILQPLDSENVDYSVVIENDSLSAQSVFEGKFDYVIGNPPWAGRGTKQIAHDFVLNIPNLLTTDGSACFILPSKVLFNKTDAFQLKMFEALKLEKVLLLADYRFILFENAICPSLIARFKMNSSETGEYNIDYEVPKVQNLDRRSGIIPISPQDRKKIPAAKVVSAAREGLASLVWKEAFWGTPADLKLLDYLKTFSKLGELTGSPTEGKRWIKGQGFQPKKSTYTGDSFQDIDWDPRDLIVSPSELKGVSYKSKETCSHIGDYLEGNGYHLTKVHRKRNESIYLPPLILVNQGFSVCTFFDYKVRFQDSLQSISGPEEDSDILLFLSVYMKSKLAQYFLFHTSANWGLERDKVHLFELMRLPFMLPNYGGAVDQAGKIVEKVVREVKAFHQSMVEFKLDTKSEAEKAAELQNKLDQYFYQYFDLAEQEIVLVEDTVDIYIPSSTPSKINTRVPSTTPIFEESQTRYKSGLKAYAETIAKQLNEWSEQSGDGTKVCVEGGVSKETNLAIVSLKFSDEASRFKKVKVETAFARVLENIRKKSTVNSGNIDYLKGLFIYEDKEIHIIKSADLINWTNSSAINDAAKIYADIVSYRARAKN